MQLQRMGTRGSHNPISEATFAGWNWGEPSLPAPDTKNHSTQQIVALLQPSSPPSGFGSGMMLKWFYIHLQLMDPSFIYSLNVINLLFSFIFSNQSQPLQNETLKESNCLMTKPITNHTQVKKRMLNIFSSKLKS